jgi:hypothetical protein
MPLAQPALTALVDIWPEVKRFFPLRPVIHFERVLRIQGYADLTRVRPVISRAAEAMSQTAASLSEPAVAYKLVEIRSLHEDLLETEDGSRLHCMAFGRQLRGCRQIAPFVLSAGIAIPERVAALIEAGDLLEAVLLEAAGWLAIEDATRQFKTHLRESCLRRDCRITSRMGPGYSYKVANRMHMWPLEEQAALFALFGEAELPVTLMKSCAMNPKMSRSGIYGIAPVAAANVARVDGPAVSTSN